MKTENRTAEEVEAYQSWEDNNRNHRSGINPEAYVLGYKAAKTKDQSTITRLQEELKQKQLTIDHVLKCNDEHKDYITELTDQLNDLQSKSDA
jgi:predicted metallo-beta-lactamase superfamily hydrolase